MKSYLEAGNKSTDGKRKVLAQYALDMDIPEATTENRPLAALHVGEEAEEQVDADRKSEGPQLERSTATQMDDG